jgi:hypothetical protein
LSKFNRPGAAQLAHASLGWHTLQFASKCSFTFNAARLSPYCLAAVQQLHACRKNCREHLKHVVRADSATNAFLPDMQCEYSHSADATHAASACCKHICCTILLLMRRSRMCVCVSAEIKLKPCQRSFSCPQAISLKAQPPSCYRSMTPTVLLIVPTTPLAAAAAAAAV